MSKDTFASLAHLGFPEPVVEAIPTAEGGWLLRSPLELAAYPPTLLHALREHATDCPDRVALCDYEPGGIGRQVRFGEFWQTVLQIASRLKSICNGRPLLILSGNSIEHAMVRLGAMAAGIAAAPVSPGYSLAAESHEKLQHVYKVCQPGALFVQDTRLFQTALQSLQPCPPVIAVHDEGGVADFRLVDWISGPAAKSPPEIDIDAIDPDSAAQIMFSSGSTGMPKGVIHTHDNLVSSLTQTQLVIVHERDRTGANQSQNIASWLPWHHVSGAGGLLLGLFRGFSHYIDPGKPIPGQEKPTIDLLRRVPLSFYVNVPLGYEMLINAFESDRELAESFFATIRFLIFGGAGIPSETFQRFDRLSKDIKGVRVPFISAYGSTETTGSITFTYFDADATGLIGLPVPGVELKLFPCHGKFEIYVKGSNVTPGYLQGRVGLFDDEGYFKTGDLVEWVDEGDFNKGLRFAGRKAEEFKLSSGTWVAASLLRSRLCDFASPLVKEVVICGLNRAYIGALVWLDESKCRQVDAGFDARLPWQSKVVLTRLEHEFRRHNRAYPATSMSVRRVMLMTEPLVPEAGEISDKGSVCSQKVLELRAGSVERLYSSEAPDILTL